MKWSNTLMLIRRLRFVDSLLVVYELPLSVQEGGEAALLKSEYVSNRPVLRTLNIERTKPRPNQENVHPEVRRRTGISVSR
jgi:hypothetical protein